MLFALVSIPFFSMLLLFPGVFFCYKSRIRNFVRSAMPITLLLLTSFFIRFFVVPHYNSVYTDEIANIKIATNILKGDAPNVRLAHPLLNSIFFLIFGESRLLPTYVSSFFDTLTLLIIFLLCSSVMKSRYAGFFAATLYAVSYTHLTLPTKA